jgi:hypothetical protein
LDRISDVLIKCGALSSLTGVAILMALITVLLVYPVSKNCENNFSDCEFISQSPEPLRGIVQPLTLVTSLAGIAAGILLLRLGMWRRSAKIT